MEKNDKTGLTLVLGASLKSFRYSYDAVQSLRNRGFDVFAVGSREGYIGDVKVHLPFTQPGQEVDTITIYMNASNQQAYYSFIFSLMPRRIIFNPGAENEELSQLARSKGIVCENACTLVLLATGAY